jgi:hypothetical protein
MKRQYEVNLGYTKKGDDAAGCQEPGGEQSAGFLRHAEMLEDDAKTLRRIAVLLTEKRVEYLESDTHWIWISCDEEFGDQLMKNEGVIWRDIEHDAEDDLAYKSECEDLRAAGLPVEPDDLDA